MHDCFRNQMNEIKYRPLKTVLRMSDLYFGYKTEYYIHTIELNNPNINKKI